MINRNSCCSLRFLVFVYIILVGCDTGVVEPVDKRADPGPIEILFIGNSYLAAHDVPKQVENLSVNNNIEATVSTIIKSGYYLTNHSTDPITEAKIKEKKWDYVVMQGYGTTIGYPEYYIDFSVYRALKTLRGKIKSNHSATKIIYCMPWAFENGVSWLGDWTDDYVEMQDKIYNNTLALSRDVDFLIAPVGWAWKKVLTEKGFPEHYLHDNYGSLPSLRGSYLVACVIYSTAYKLGTNGNSYLAGLPSAEGREIQEVATHMVMDSLNLWNF